MVSQNIFYLGDERYYCIGTPEEQKLSEDNVDHKTWKCKCCGEPVLIKADNNGAKTQYIRLSVKDVMQDDYIYIRSSGFLKVLDAGKHNSSYFLSIKGYRRLNNLTEEHFCLVERSGRFTLVYR